MSRRIGIATLVAALSLVASSMLAAQPSAGRFMTVDVFVDSAEPVAAWQFELGERNGSMQVVGIERGENPTFREPPFYDRSAVDGGRADRIVLASFSLSDAASLPRGRVRIARVHVRLTGAATPDYELRLVAAGAADGRAIDAAISLETRTER